MKKLHLALMVASLLAAVLFLCGSPLAQTSDALVVDENGNVGIGVAVPETRLHIEGDGQQVILLEKDSVVPALEDAHGELRFRGAVSSGTEWISAFIRSIHVNNLGSRRSALTFGVPLLSPGDAQEAMRIDYGGNVGIGTTSPEVRLHIRSSTSTMAIERYSDTASAAPGQILRRARGTPEAYAVVQAEDWLGGLYWQGWSVAGNGFKNAVRIRALVDGEPDSLGDDSDMPGRLEFQTTPDNTADLVTRMTIKSDGKVGIGSTNPASLLHLQGSEATILLKSTVNGYEQLSRTMPGLELSIGQMNATTHRYGSAIKFMSTDPGLATENPKFLAAIMPRATETYAADTDGGMALDFATTPNDPGASSVPAVRMTIDQDGNVGIGTSSAFGGGKGVLSIGQTSVPPVTNPTDAALFYVYDGVMYVLDEVGNAQPISTHPAEEIETLAASDDPYPLFQKSTNKVIGKEIVIDKGKAFRLLQKLFPKEQFIWYRDVPRVDVTVQQRQEWKKNWIAQNTSEQEVSKDAALELVEVMVEDTSKVVGEKVTYALEGREVIAIKTPVYSQNAEQKWQLREGAWFDPTTGRFFMRITPTEEEAEVAASQQFQPVMKKWISDRM